MVWLITQLSTIKQPSTHSLLLPLTKTLGLIGVLPRHRAIQASSQFPSLSLQSKWNLRVNTVIGGSQQFYQCWNNLLTVDKCLIVWTNKIAYHIFRQDPDKRIDKLIFDKIICCKVLKQIFTPHFAEIWSLNGFIKNRFQLYRHRYYKIVNQNTTKTVQWWP